MWRAIGSRGVDHATQRVARGGDAGNRSCRRARTRGPVPWTSGKKTFRISYWLANTALISGARRGRTPAWPVRGMQTAGVQGSMRHHARVFRPPPRRQRTGHSEVVGVASKKFVAALAPSPVVPPKDRRGRASPACRSLACKHPWRSFGDVGAGGEVDNSGARPRDLRKTARHHASRSTRPPFASNARPPAPSDRGPARSTP